jgi:isochorismate synthase
MAASGIAAEIFAWGHNRINDVQRQAKMLFDDAVFETAPPRLFGGFAFRDDFVPDNTWAVFHPAHFVLPHVQFWQDGDWAGGWLTLNALVHVEDSVTAVQASLREALQARLRWLQDPVQAPDPTQVTSSRVVRYPLSQAAWSHMVESAVSQINQNVFNKVVLARVSEVRDLDAKIIDTDAALAYLQKHYNDCYNFVFEPRPHHAFLGATPELLVRVHGNQLASMALAGSIKRGRDAAEDATFAQTLLNSAKDLHEHSIVVDEIRRRLQPLATALDVAPQPKVLKLGNIQHLLTPVQAQLAQADGALSLVELLHPTPALGGQPREAAMAFIREHEPVTRGWYAAPVGWLGPSLDGVFCVAIRSAVTQRERAWLYAGSGIVASSRPQAEWDETAIKFRPMLQALGASEATP